MRNIIKFVFKFYIVIIVISSVIEIFCIYDIILSRNFIEYDLLGIGIDRRAAIIYSIIILVLNAISLSLYFIKKEKSYIILLFLFLMQFALFYIRMNYINL